MAKVRKITWNEKIFSRLPERILWWKFTDFKLTRIAPQGKRKIPIQIIARFPDEDHQKQEDLDRIIVKVVFGI